MSSIIHSTTNDSWILEKILVGAIGRKAYNNNNKIFIYTDKKDRSVNYID
jgi:hypothetical protein